MIIWTQQIVKTGATQVKTAGIFKKKKKTAGIWGFIGEKPMAKGDPNKVKRWRDYCRKVIERTMKVEWTSKRKRIVFLKALEK